jgi:hypothetical protein
MMVWSGPRKLRSVAAPMARTSPFAQQIDDLVVEVAWLPVGRATPPQNAAILLRDHLQNRPYILSHAAVDKHQALLQASARLR